jgi:hypothetical protein
MDPSDVGATDISSGGTNGGSNGLDINGLMGSLLDNATTAYVTNQQSAAAQAALSAPSNPLAFITGGSGRSWLIVGAGVLALALILRR